MLIPINDSLYDYAMQYIEGGDEEIRITCEYWRKIISAVGERDEGGAATLIKQLLLHFVTYLPEDPMGPDSFK